MLQMGNAFAPNDVLRFLRTSLGITQKAMALELTCDSAWLCAIERGHARMGAKTGQRIEKRYGPDMARLGITLSDLLRGRRELPEASRAAG